MTRKLLVGAIVAGAFAITAGTAVALTGGGDTAPTPASSTATSTSRTATPTDTTELTADDARRIVQARYGGTVREVEREQEHGRMEWDVEIDAADGHHYEVRIDVRSGEITRVEQDDDHDDDRHDDRHDDDRHGDDD